jgi:hypothetical protein
MTVRISITCGLLMNFLKENRKGFTVSQNTNLFNNISSVICPENAQRDIPLYIPATIIQTGISARVKEVIPHR